MIQNLLYLELLECEMYSNLFLVWKLFSVRACVRACVRGCVCVCVWVCVGVCVCGGGIFDSQFL